MGLLYVTFLPEINRLATLFPRNKKKCFFPQIVFSTACFIKKIINCNDNKLHLVKLFLLHLHLQNYDL